MFKKISDALHSVYRRNKQPQVTPLQAKSNKEVVVQSDKIDNVDAFVSKLIMMMYFNDRMLLSNLVYLNLPHTAISLDDVSYISHYNVIYKEIKTSVLASPDEYLQLYKEQTRIICNLFTIFSEKAYKVHQVEAILDTNNKHEYDGLVTAFNDILADWLTREFLSRIKQYEINPSLPVRYRQMLLGALISVTDLTLHRNEIYKYYKSFIIDFNDTSLIRYSRRTDTILHHVMRLENYDTLNNINSLSSDIDFDIVGMKATPGLRLLIDIYKSIDDEGEVTYTLADLPVMVKK